MGIFRCSTCGAMSRWAGASSVSVCPRCRHPLDTSGRAQRVDGAALVSAIVSSPAPVLVEFSGPGAVGAGLERLGPELAGHALLLSVDTSADPAAARAYHVGSARTLVLFSRGFELARCERAPAPGELSGWMQRAAAAPPSR